MLYRVAIAVVVGTFTAYFCLIAYCDLFPPEPLGADLVATAGGTIVRAVDAGSAADRAGLTRDDTILSVEGRPIRNVLDWSTVFARVDFGRPMTVTLQRGPAARSTELIFHEASSAPWTTPSGAIHLMSRLIQFVTLGFAVALAIRGVGVSAALGFWLLATISVFRVGLPYRLATIWQTLPLPLSILFLLPSISTVVLGGILCAFFASLLNVRPSRSLVTALALPFVLICLWRVAFITTLVYRPEFLERATGWVSLVTVTNLLYILLSMAILAVYYRTVTNASDRRRLRWVLAGSIFGCASGAPAVGGMWLGVTSDPTALYRSFGLQMAYTAFLVMPISFWWAIARHHLFDINFVVRRGLQYLFARRALLVMSPVIVGAIVVEGTLHAQESFQELLRHHALLYASTLAAVVMFQSRRSTWLEALDRRLFRERYDACQLLRAVASQTRTTKDLRAAAEFMVAQVESALHPEWLAIYHCLAADEQFGILAAHGDVAPSWLRRASLMDFVRTLKKPLDIDLEPGSWLREHLPEGELEMLRGAAVSLVVPVRVNLSGPEIVFALGAKRSGEPFSAEDKNLLAAVAESLGDVAVAAPVPEKDSTSEPGADNDASWNEHMQWLADAVSDGARIDWTRELAMTSTERQREDLVQMRGLERLMEAHGAWASGRNRSAQGAESSGGAAGQWGDFALRERIGTGSFGSVYRAWDPKLEREVAVKLLDVDRPNRTALLGEARHLARVRHQNVVHVYGADEVAGTAGFWMELIEGKTLSDLLREQGRFGAGEAAAVGVAICRALSAIHLAGMVHQDVKAQNVMREVGGRLVLMDLGAVVPPGVRGVSRWGTPAYMGPELFFGESSSARSDVYSLGVLLFHLTTGRFPNEGQTFEAIAECHRLGQALRLRDLRPDLPDAFLDTIDHALALDPVRRFETAGELGAAIRLVGAEWT